MPDAAKKCPNPPKIPIAKNRHRKINHFNDERAVNANFGQSGKMTFAKERYSDKSAVQIKWHVHPDGTFALS